MQKGKFSVILCNSNLCPYHLSGDPEASGDDIKLTERLAEIVELMGIDVLDRIINHRWRIPEPETGGLVLRHG